MSTAAPETQLVAIPKETALSVFTTDKAMDPFLARIRQELDAFVPDISTTKGRKAVASMAYSVAQSKTYLDGVGKALADEQKKIPKKIDACRKRVRDTLDQWRDEVRKPLTDWELAEEARLTRHCDAIAILNSLPQSANGQTSAWIAESLSEVEAVIIGPHCDEFEAEYARAKDAARLALTLELEKAKTREAEAVELARLRAESEARERADRDEAIRRDAAAEATRLAEAEAQRRIDAEIAAANAAREEAEAATRRATETEARLKQEAEDQKAHEAAEARKREADTNHRAAINRAAVSAFVAGGMTQEAAKLAVQLIAKKTIPAITITY